MVKVRANIRFKDKEWGEIWRAQGDVWNVDVDRAWQLTQTKHNQNYFCDYDELPWDDSKGPRILIYNYDLYKIGGTETFLYNLCKYYKDKNIIVLYKTGKSECLDLLHPYCQLVRDDGKRTYTCELFCTTYLSTCNGKAKVSNDTR